MPQCQHCKNRGFHKGWITYASGRTEDGQKITRAVNKPCSRCNGSGYVTKNG